MAAALPNMPKNLKFALMAFALATSFPLATPGLQAQICADCVAGSSTSVLRRNVLPRDAASRRESLQASIHEAAARHGVDPRLVQSLIQVESDFNSGAISPKGAMGLMQLMPATARRWGVANPLDPIQNLEGGVQHLKMLLASYRGDLRLSLAAYNAGEAAVARSGGVPPFPETIDYVDRVSRLYGQYSGRNQGVLSGSPAPIFVHRDARGLLCIANTE